jgi:N-acetylneuraminate synthase/sialic acid synthase
VRELTIDGVRIADDAPCYVIAEIGSNHGGNVETAIQMIGAAADCGVQAVKFQLRDNETLYSRELLDAPYENENSYGKTYGEHRAVLELDESEHRRCQMAAQRCRVAYCATAFDERSADVLAAMDVPAIKIASGGLTDLPLLRHVAGLGKPIILSTGGGTFADVDRAVGAIIPTNVHLALLHCTASYPCAFEELNLRCIPVLRERYPDLVIGWSSHDNGIAMSVAAYTLGARILEKHFTLNRASKGTDHAFSLEPAGLRKLCRDLERARRAMGDGIKRFYESERKPISKMRRVPTAHGWQITGALHDTHSEAGAQ